MPLKMSKRGGGTKKVSFQQGVNDLKKQGKSDLSARKIMGKIQKVQDKGKAVKPGTKPGFKPFKKRK